MLIKSLLLLVALLSLSGCRADPAARAPEKQTGREVTPAVRVTIVPDKIAERLG